MAKCKCCKEEISEVQNRWSGLCPLCDIGTCQKPSAYHQLRNNYLELLKQFENLKTSPNKDFTAQSVSPKVCSSCKEPADIVLYLLEDGEHCRNGCY